MVIEALSISTGNGKHLKYPPVDEQMNYSTYTQWNTTQQYKGKTIGHLTNG